METCMTLGMLNREQAQQLAGAGLDYYNHNIDTSARYYGSIVGTRTFVTAWPPIPAKVTITSCFGGLAWKERKPA
jgi:hypothetical protein